MSYAVKKNGKSFRAVAGPLDIMGDENFSISVPTLPWSNANVLTEARTLREKILNRLAGIGMAAVIDGDSVTATSVVEAREALLDITIWPAVVAATDDQSLKLAIVLRYQQIALAATPSVRDAFKEVDS